MSKMNTPRQPQTSVDTSSRIEMIQDTSPSYSRATPMFYSKDRFLGVANNLRPWDYVVNKSNVRKGRGERNVYRRGIRSTEFISKREPLLDSP